jgi:glucosamine--fructose-6-phosphate aminotransferase (isomerizing)
VRNAHPHRAGRVSVVHNGIIENFRELREELAARASCRSPTPTPRRWPILANHLLSEGATPQEAVEQTLEGSTAPTLSCSSSKARRTDDRRPQGLAPRHRPRRRRDVRGLDAIALAPFTDRITYLEEGDWAVVTRAGAQIRDLEGRLANRPPSASSSTPPGRQGGHRHFMAKEIASSPPG